MRDTIRFRDTRDGSFLQLPRSSMCPDCNTPAAILNERNELVRICHDQSCPRRTTGISNRLHLQIYGEKLKR